jgi:hypothetical protein
VTNQHPNATVAAVSTFGGGELVVELLDELGVHISAPVGVAIAGGIATVALFVGRKGLRGVWNLIVNGTQGGQR